MSGAFLVSIDVDSILTALEQSRLIEDVTMADGLLPAIKCRNVIVTFDGLAEIEGHPIRIQIGLDAFFPLSLPIICLAKPEKLGFPPHIETDGNICYAEKEGLLLNQNNPSGIVEQALHKAIETVKKGLKQENKVDYVDEFELYWGRLANAQIFISFISPDNQLRKITILKKQVETNIFYFACDDVRTVQSFYNLSNPPSETHYSGLYIPLKAGTIVVPPRPGTFWKLEDIQKLATDNLSKRLNKLLKQFTRKWKREEIVIFGLPRASGGTTLFGVLCAGIENNHPLRSGSTVQSISPLIAERRDLNYLLPRGGVASDFQYAHVLLIGCGAIGGFLAADLVRAGILNLTLLDPDKLSIENTFRHILGREYVDKFKVEALKEEIGRKYPYTKIITISEAIESVLSKNSINFDQFALIIVATGNPTVNLYLNSLIHSSKAAIPTIYVWLEPYGIGGHVLLAQNNKQGCLECLYTTPIDDDSESYLYNRASFAASGQSFARSLSGCGGSFTPYGALHAVKTANLACEIAIDVLAGNAEGNPLISWKGGSKAFLEAGFKLSSRYNMPETELYQHRFDYQNAHCKVCGHK